MWNPSVSLPIFWRGFAYQVELYYFPLEFLGAVEMPSEQETRITRGSTVLRHSPEDNCLRQCRLSYERGGGAHI